MAPVILKMDVHCDGCAAKIRKAIRNMLGVERVWVSQDTGLVVVTGTADALALRRRLRRKTRRSVTIVSDGTGAPEVPPDGGITHLAPQPTYAVLPSGYPPHYTWPATALTAAPYVAAPAPAGYLYGNQWVSTTQHQYVPGGTPTRFVEYDDDETPDGCCSVQ